MAAQFCHSCAPRVDTVVLGRPSPHLETSMCLARWPRCRDLKGGNWVPHQCCNEAPVFYPISSGAVPCCVQEGSHRDLLYRRPFGGGSVIFPQPSCMGLRARELVLLFQSYKVLNFVPCTMMQVVLVTLTERGCHAWPKGMERPPG